MSKPIPRPEDDPHFQKLRKQQHKVHEEIRANSEVVEKFKARRAASESVIGPQGGRHAPTKADEEKAKAASRAVRAARSKLRDLEIPLREARSAAAKRIMADVRPEYLKRIGEFTLAVLRQRADQLVALGSLLAMREDLNARQISMVNLPIPPFERNLERTEWKYQIAREDTRAMVEAGAIKAGDLPSALAKAWGIK